MSDRIRDVFAAIDRMDPEGFAAFFEEDGTFKFGNAAPAVGRGSVRDAVGAFFSTINGLSHTLEDVWEPEGWALARGTVTYTRKDASTLTLPVLSAMRLAPSGQIRDYLVYMDVNPLFNP